jgi:hypothetical protein
MTYFRRELEYQHEVELALAHGRKPPERSERNPVMEAIWRRAPSKKKCLRRWLNATAARPLRAVHP